MPKPNFEEADGLGISQLYEILYVPASLFLTFRILKEAWRKFNIIGKRTPSVIILLGL